jgi:hypothetical protein
MNGKPKVPLLQVRPIPADLLERVNAAAALEGLTTKQFVINVLEEETKDPKPIQEARKQRRAKQKVQGRAI